MLFGVSGPLPFITTCVNQVATHPPTDRPTDRLEHRGACKCALSLPRICHCQTTYTHVPMAQKTRPDTKNKPLPTTI